MAKSVTFCAFMLILSSLTACQQSKDLGEMHDNTAEMNKSTKDMKESLAEMQTSMEAMLKNTQALNANMQALANATSKSLGETNDHMSVMVTNMSDLLTATNGLCQTRHAQSTLTRTDAFKKMIEAKSPEEKVARATEYLMGFEFQLWGLCQDDTLASREVLMTTAAQEFFFDLSEIKSSTASAAAMASLKAAADPKNVNAALDMNFNAVAVALHGVDDVQKSLIARYNLAHKPAIQPASMLSIIEGALRADTNSATPSQHMVLAKHRLAVRLLQARHNFAVAVVIGAFATQSSNGVGTDISLFLNQHPFLRGALAGIKLQSTPVGAAKWDTSIDGFTADELNDLSLQLGLALETRGFLKSIGVKAKVDEALAPFVEGMVVKTTKQGSADLIAKRQLFYNLFTKIRTL